MNRASSSVTRIGRGGGDAIVLPASFAQQRLWLIDRLTPGSSLYNIARSIRLRGSLDAGALERGLREIVHRHEALRTTFISDEGYPMQVVHAQFHVPIDHTDLTDLTESARSARFEEILEADAARPFDLVTGPVFRARLVRLAAHEHALILGVHHIAADGWSLDVLLRELGVLYGAFVAGNPSPLPELPVQYADYSQWQREWLQGDVLQEQLDYWTRQLAELPPLALPSDRPRPASSWFFGGQVDFDVPADTLTLLREFTHRERVTPFMVLHAAFQALLARYSGQDEFAVGTPHSGRSRTEFEDIIGFFANTIVLRADLRADPSFRTLIARVRNCTLDALSHADLPFDRLVEQLHPTRESGRTPIIQAMFSAEQVLGMDSTLPGLRAETIPNPEKITAKFELSLFMVDHGDCLRGEFEYDRSLHDHAFAQALASHFTVLLSNALAEPDRPLSAIPLLSEEEQRLAGARWNNTARAYPRDATVDALFAVQAARTPDAIAIVCGEQSLSYSELNRRSDQLAQHLRTLGISCEQRVGLLLGRTPELVIAMLGVLKAGGAYLPLDINSGPGRLRALLGAAAARVLVTTTELFNKHMPAPTPAPPALVLLDRDQAVLDRMPTTTPPRISSAERLAYAMYTSGSTGLPKGVAITHRSIVRLVCAQDYVTLGPDASVLHMAPPAFDAATFEVWGPLLTGGRCVLYPDAIVDTHALATLLQEQRVNTVWLTASLFNAIIDTAPEALRGVRQLVVGGEALSVPHVRRALECLPDTRIVNGYGPTEGTTFSCCHVITRPLDAACRSVPIGAPIANTRAYVLDRALRPVPAGVVGELFVGGDGLARGYLEGRALTAARFVPDPFADGTPERPAGARLYRTGDLVRQRADGVLDFIGRTDRQLKLRGFRIEPGEIETALRAHPRIREAAVVVPAESRQNGDRRLVAYIEARADGSLEALAPAALKEFLSARLPAVMIPHAIVVCSALPLTASGKIDHRSLASLAIPADVQAVGEGRLPANGARNEARWTPIETQIADLFADTLGCERRHIGRTDSFFGLGGHSLLATRLAARALQVLGVDVPLLAFFDNPTVVGVAEIVAQRGAQARASGASALAPADAGRIPRAPAGNAPASFAQSRLWFLDRLAPGTSEYNVPWALRIEGALDHAILERSLHEIVRRHDILRTTLVISDGSPVQVVSENARIQLELIDLSMLAGADRELELRRCLTERAEALFDLAHGPVARAHLVKLTDAEHVLLLCIHHIACDGWSLDVLFLELGELYDAFLDGHPSPLPELPIRYADYALWQRERSESAPFQRHRIYWREQLQNLPALDLPADRRIPDAPTHRGADFECVLPPTAAATLRELAGEENATPFMVLLAAVKLLLASHAHQTDIAVASPVAGRTHADTEKLIGFFVNTLVLRTDLSGDPTFRQLVNRVRATTLAALEHQEVPFEQVVDELRAERDPREPLASVMVVFQDVPGTVPALRGLRVTHIPITIASAKFELTFSFRETSAGLAVLLEYSTDSYDAPTAERLALDLCALLRVAIAHPDVPASSLPASDDADSGWWIGAQPRLQQKRVLMRLADRNRAVPVAARDPLEQRLLTIWENVLDVRGLGVRDSFFEMGGHSLLAVRLFAEIHQWSGRELPLAALFRAPTVERFAELLRSEGWAAAWSPLVPLSSHGAEPPLFLVHAIGGNVLNYRDIARHLGVERPVFGLQAVGLDGKELPNARIEDLAARYLAEVRKAQPAGPYNLGGSSFGGVVAFEMARQLRAAGEALAALLLFDCVPSVRDCPDFVAPGMRTTLRSLSHRVQFHAGNLWRLPLGEKLTYVQAKGSVVRERVQQRVTGRAMAPQNGNSLFASGLREVKRANKRAFAAYRPGRYDSPVTLFRSSDTARIAHGDPTLGWSRYVTGEITVFEAPGNHRTMIMEPYATTLAQQVRDVLASRGAEKT